MSDFSVILIGLLAVLVWLFVTMALGIIDQRISGNEKPTVSACLKDSLIVEGGGVIVFGALLFITIAGLWALGKFVLSFWVR